MLSLNSYISGLLPLKTTFVLWFFSLIVGSNSSRYRSWMSRKDLYTVFFIHFLFSFVLFSCLTYIWKRLLYWSLVKLERGNSIFFYIIWPIYFDFKVIIRVYFFFYKLSWCLFICKFTFFIPNSMLIYIYIFKIILMEVLHRQGRFFYLLSGI